LHAKIQITNSKYTPKSTFCRVRLTTVAVEKKQMILCVFLKYKSLSTVQKYSVLNENVSMVNLWRWLKAILMSVFM